MPELLGYGGDFNIWASDVYCLGGFHLEDTDDDAEYDGDDQGKEDEYFVFMAIGFEYFVLGLIRQHPKWSGMGLVPAGSSDLDRNLVGGQKARSVWPGPETK